MENLKNSSKLTREQMKKISGGTNKTVWACYGLNGYFLADVCSYADPANPSCQGIMCTNTGVSCGDATLCP